MINNLYSILKQCLYGVELIRAHWGIFYSSPMFNRIDALLMLLLN